MPSGIHDHLNAIAAEASPSTVEAVTRVLSGSQKPARAAFLARALNAVAKLAGELDERALGDAAGAQSDLSTLLRALEHPAAQSALVAEDPLALARLRGLRARAALLQAEGGTLGASALAELLGISRQAVDKRRRAGTLLGILTGRHGYYYPAWQLNGRRGMLPGLAEVLQALGDLDPWMQLAFMINGNARLDNEAPLALLRRGEIAPVIRAAHAFGEHGAA